MNPRSRPTPRRGRAPANPPAAKAQVQSLTRGLSILDCLAHGEHGLTLTDIAQRTQLPPSTVHRLLATLERSGHVYQADGEGSWYVGLAAFVVGSSFLASRGWIAQSHRYMRELMEQSQETISLATLDGTEAVFIDQVQCHQMMRTIVKLGGRAPLHASGAGKAMFAALADEEIAAILAAIGLPRITDRTITVTETLWANLRAIRQRGWSLDDEEHAAGIRCVASSIYDEHAEMLGAISVTGPSLRLTDARIRELGPAVASKAEEITRQIGGRWPHPW